MQYLGGAFWGPSYNSRLLRSWPMFQGPRCDAEVPLDRLRASAIRRGGLALWWGLETTSGSWPTVLLSKEAKIL